MKMIPPEALPTANFRRGVGCNECLQTGFHGRTAITEMLVVDEVFRDAVLQKMPTRALQQVAVQQGMQTMWQGGLDRALAGQTTLEEVLRVVAVEQI